MTLPPLFSIQIWNLTINWHMKFKFQKRRPAACTTAARHGGRGGGGSWSESEGEKVCTFTFESGARSMMARSGCCCCCCCFVEVASHGILLSLHRWWPVLARWPFYLATKQRSFNVSSAGSNMITVCASFLALNSSKFPGEFCEVFCHTSFVGGDFLL